MVPIIYCTITGADDSVDQDRLVDISLKYPFVEWGILMSKNNVGIPRYPSLEWVDGFIERCSDMCNTSCHVCGSLIDEMMNDSGVFPEWGRMQLNIGKSIDEDKLLRFIEESDIPIITQHNQHTARISCIAPSMHHHLLFDESRGTGVPFSTVNAPIAGRFCGYAGGITPDTLETTLVAITNVTGTKPFWIDIESGVRTNDVFDIDKVVKALEIVDGARRKIIPS